MDALQFAYWLQGFAELSGDEPPTAAQWQSIREHLGTVFKKVTPPVIAPTGPMSWGPIPDASKHFQPLRAECSAWIAPASDGLGTMVIC